MSQTQTAAQPQASTNSLDALMKLVMTMPEGAQRLELEYALGLKQRPKPNPFKFVVKTNEKTSKQYVVIAIDGAKVQFSVKTASLIIDQLDQFVDIVGEASDAEKVLKAVK